jgi:hypothetical protein
MHDHEDLTKIVVDLPNHWAAGGEGIWAKPLGDDLYEIVPFHAYGLNFGDVVRAVEPAPDKKPLVLEVIRPSGHRTLRVFFPDSVPEDQRLELLRSLEPLGAEFERATAGYFALDVHLLEYETCEPRAAGRFDEGPDAAPPDAAV